MTISLNLPNKNNWIPKEISTASLGVVISATSNVAMQIFDCNCIRIPYIVVHFITYGSIATSIAGAVMAVFSSVHLCKKIISKESDLYKAISATALGILLTSTAGLVSEYADTVCDHVYRISSSFYQLDANSKALYIGANFVWHACLIIGIASVAFTAYAAYRVGKAALADAN